MVDLFAEAHDPVHALLADDKTVERLTQELREATAKLRREVAYRVVWNEYQRVRRQVDLVTR